MRILLRNLIIVEMIICLGMQEVIFISMAQNRIQKTFAIGIKSSQNTRTGDDRKNRKNKVSLKTCYSLFNFYEKDFLLN